MENLLCLLLLALLFCWVRIVGSALNILHDAGTIQETPVNRSLQVAKLTTANPPHGYGASRRHDYLNNSELEESMKNFVRKCQNVSRMYSIGHSVLGFPLWVIEISNNPGLQEPKPSFKFVGNLHGNEPTGRQILLSLAHWLCEHRKDDSAATFIIDNVHLHLLPTMNPDGFVAKNRTNANGIDLNRDFPDQFLPWNNDPKRRQPETRAVMDWIRKNHFVASASLHEGALVANYPWDGSNDGKVKHSPSPDDATFRHLAALYAHAHPTMAKTNAEFPTGITNGASWYPLYGGMQDWNYIHGGCFELTVEVDAEQWPPYDRVASIAKEHRRSMLDLVAAVVNSAIHGRVISSTGAPLAATITVKGITQSVYASANFGDFHRLLVPGRRYEVTASMWGYNSRSTSIMLYDGKPAYVDFILEPAQYLPPNILLRGEAAKSHAAEQDWAQNWSHFVGVTLNGHLQTGEKSYVSAAEGSSEEITENTDRTMEGEWNSSAKVKSTDGLSGMTITDESYVSQLRMEGLGISSLGALLAVAIALVYIMLRWRGFKLLRARQFAS